MRLLIVTATTPEVTPLVAQFSHRANASPALRTYAYRDHEIHVLTTGVGMVATGVWSARTLAASAYDLALNLGVCGSFDPALPPGRVVHVVAEQMPELGVEDGERFLPIHELQLLGENDFPFQRGRLLNANPPDIAALRALPAVNGITVNTVHGGDASIAAVVERLRPQVESMEGAAFMYACLVQGVPFAQVRAVSNIVERRNRAAWKLPEAIASLTRTAQEILEHA
jgi:futalosine hydrolase